MVRKEIRKMCRGRQTSALADFPTLQAPNWTGKREVMEMVESAVCVWIKNSWGQLTAYPVISPSRWQGEGNCVVGSFSSHEVAEAFVGLRAKFGRFGAVVPNVFVQGDAWFIKT